MCHLYFHVRSDQLSTLIHNDLFLLWHPQLHTHWFHHVLWWYRCSRFGSDCMQFSWGHLPLILKSWPSFLSALSIYRVAPSTAGGFVLCSAIKGSIVRRTNDGNLFPAEPPFSAIKRFRINLWLSQRMTTIAFNSNKIQAQPSCSFTPRNRIAEVLHS